MRNVTCPTCRKEHQINLNHCPYCQTAVTDELKDVRRNLMAQDEAEREVTAAKKAKLGLMIFGCLIALVIVDQVISPSKKEYAVPSTVETETTVSADDQAVVDRIIVQCGVALGFLEKGRTTEAFTSLQTPGMQADTEAYMSIGGLPKPDNFAAAGKVALMLPILATAAKDGSIPMDQAMNDSLSLIYDCAKKDGEL